ncbi:MAG TPA: SH3 domain-containing protein [Anaerolineae bacterium]|nr:SH3 domain-containing protein [Anaerolineae bacterium]
MARYQKPTDPRESETRRGPRRANSPIPWRWFGGGVLVSLFGVVVAWWLVSGLLSRPPLPTAVGGSGLTPTVIRLTAPPTIPPSPTSLLPTATTLPTLTPQPTPDLATPPPDVMVGFYAAVANTEELGVTVRAGPGIQNSALQLAAEGSVLLVIGGPREASGLEWWQVELPNGEEGWVAAPFLEPAPAPLP